METSSEPPDESHSEHTIPSIGFDVTFGDVEMELSGNTPNPYITVSTSPNINNMGVYPRDNSQIRSPEPAPIAAERQHIGEKRPSNLGSSISIKISYSLRVRLRELSPPIDDILHSADSEGYARLESDAEKHVEASFPKVSKLQFRHGTCKVNVNGQAFPHSLASTEDLEHISEICLTMLKKCFDGQTVHLDIVRDYAALDAESTYGGSFLDQIQHQLHGLRKCGSNGQDKRFYVLENDLKAILSPEVTTSIVQQDTSMSATQKTDEFWELVKANPKLLAMAITTRLQMTHLKHFLEYHHITDSSLPIKDSSRCKCQLFGPNYDLFEAKQHDFIPPFLELGSHNTFPSGTVLPIQFIPRKLELYTEWPHHYFEDTIVGRGDEEFARLKRDAHLGNGTSSDVYRVRIDPRLHNISKNKDAAFALKVFRNRPSEPNLDRTKKAFDKEMQMLSQLRRYHHEHIVTHYATWTQNDTYYMLFPYAKCNLREFWAGYSLDVERNAWWFVDQLRGLSDALRNIHNYGLYRERRKSQTLSVDAPVGNKMTGWHHDIKPENILYFERIGYGRGILKIADFGSGKVQTYREGGSSIHTNSTSGTPPYQAPDYVFKGKISRPFDVWSLGCVFLESLTWASLGAAAVDRFKAARFGSRDGFVKDAGFWVLEQGIREQNPLLREAVIDNIKVLKEKGIQSEPFLDILDVVEKRMLVTKPDSRINAVDLFNTLDSLYKAEQAARTDPHGDFQYESPSPSPMEKILPNLTIMVPNGVSADTQSMLSPSPDSVPESHRQRGVLLTPSPVNGVIPVIFTSSPESIRSEEANTTRTYSDTHG